MFTVFVNIEVFSYLCNYNEIIQIEVNFKEVYLRDLYVKGQADKKHRFQPQIVRKYIRVVDLMKAEFDVRGLAKYHSLNYERLCGDKQGLSSVRVNDKYRIEFEEQTRDGQTVASICNIVELSNLYK